MKKEKCKIIKFNKKEAGILKEFEEILKKEGRTFSWYIKRFIEKEVQKYNIYSKEWK